MSEMITITCDSDWFGFPCRGAISSKHPIEEARSYAVGRGWGIHVATGKILCPAHILAAAKIEAAR